MKDAYTAVIKWLKQGSNRPSGQDLDCCEGGVEERGRGRLSVLVRRVDSRGTSRHSCCCTRKLSEDARTQWHLETTKSSSPH